MPVATTLISTSTHVKLCYSTTMNSESRNTLQMTCSTMAPRYANL